MMKLMSFFMQLSVVSFETKRLKTAHSFVIDTYLPPGPSTVRLLTCRSHARFSVSVLVHTNVALN